MATHSTYTGQAVSLHPIWIGSLPIIPTKIREAARQFAQVIVDEVPLCADQSTAIRHIRDAVVSANAAIALDGHQ